MKRSTVPPPRKPNPQFAFVTPDEWSCLYVAELSDGRIKVGRTRTPRNRLIALASTSHPESIARFFISDRVPVDALGPAERHLIRRMGTMGAAEPRRPEWFRGVPFHTALLEAECAQQWFTATAAQ